MLRLLALMLPLPTQSGFTVVPVTSRSGVLKGWDIRTNGDMRRVSFYVFVFVFVFPTRRSTRRTSVVLEEPNVYIYRLRVTRQSLCDSTYSRQGGGKAAHTLCTRWVILTAVAAQCERKYPGRSSFQNIFYVYTFDKTLYAAVGRTFAVRR